jgi:hypothetical protein
LSKLSICAIILPETDLLTTIVLPLLGKTIIVSFLRSRVAEGNSDIFAKAVVLLCTCGAVTLFSLLQPKNAERERERERE